MNNNNSKPQSLPWTGERYVPEIGGAIELEHLHRYLIATKLVKDKKVLDIACGEGYGSDKLALFASHVIGVDIAENVVNYARSKYQRPNLEFCVGSVAEIPVKSNSIDVLVSFETIEHLDQHKKMMSEIKRVLVQEGLLIISSPNKKYYSVVPHYSNPYHVKELFTDEFEWLLKDYFSNVRMLGQRVVYGSLVVSREPSDSSFKSLTNESEDDGFSRIVYDIAITSDHPLPELHDGLFEMPIDGIDTVAYLTNRIACIERVVAERDGQIADLVRIVAEREKSLAERDQSLAERDGQITDLVRIVAERDQSLAERDGQIADLVRTEAEIISTRSWRITRPLRFASRLLRGK